MNMRQVETKNALIKSTALGPEDHGIFSAYLNLEYDGEGQSFGGYSLDKHNGVRGAGSERVGTAYGMEFIRQILEVVGVASWEKLPGKFIRVKASHMKVEAIGHITKDKWFCPETDMESFKSPTP